MLMLYSNLYFNPTTYLFCLNKDKVFLNQYCYDISTSVTWGLNSVPQILFDDFIRIFSPHVFFQGSTITGTHGSYAAEESDSEIPLIEAAEATLGLQHKYTGNYLLLSATNVKNIDYHTLEMYRGILDGKFCGEINQMFWHEEAAALIPYKLYVPSYYQENNTQFPLIVILHGGGSTPEELFDLSDHHISYLAEEKGFFVLAASGCMRNSTYGCCIPPQGLAPDSTMFNLNDQDLTERRISEHALEQVISHVCKKYPIDQNRLYLAGNSMGGMGTFYFASTHPNMFCAIAPAGAAPDIRLFDYERLVNIPIFFTAGTEDYHGYTHLRTAYQHLCSIGISVRLRTVGGGDHGMAWVKVMEEWVDFLLAH